MQAYGKRKIHSNYPDNHVQGKMKRQGYVNWWEVERTSILKARARRQGIEESREQQD